MVESLVWFVVAFFAVFGKGKYLQQEVKRCPLHDDSSRDL